MTDIAAMAVNVGKMTSTGRRSLRYRAARGDGCPAAQVDQIPEANPFSRGQDVKGCNARELL